MALTPEEAKEWEDFLGEDRYPTIQAAARDATGMLGLPLETFVMTVGQELQKNGRL